MPLRSKTQTNNLKGSQTGTSGGVSGWTDSMNNVARQVMSEFMQAGASKAGAAGVVGNMTQESSLNASEAGGGLMQWVGSRWAALVSFASASGQPVNSVSTQSKFAIHEMKTQYPGLWKMLGTTKDPQAAALAISQQYERPGDPQNQNRTKYAQLAFDAISGTGGGGGGASDTSGGGGGGGGTGAPSSILDLITSPVDAVGGWLASIAVNLLKDAAIGVVDTIVIPFWHWNQRAIDNYQNAIFTDTSGETLLWTGVFWGFGYTLLFTDPSAGNLKPAPVRNSRLARHARRIQSLPARSSLIKPSQVKERTPKKPNPVVSRATVTQTGTMATSRPTPVKVTGTHARGNDGNAVGSEIPIERAGTVTGEPPNNATNSSPVSDAEHRAGNSSLQNRAGDSGRNPSAGVSGGSNAGRR